MNEKKIKMKSFRDEYLNELEEALMYENFKSTEEELRSKLNKQLEKGQI